MIPFGAVTNPLDSLSYVAWIQQAVHGCWTFHNLYTTTPHAAAVFNPLFLALGWLARAWSVHPFILLNVAALLSIPVVVFSLNAICRGLGFSGRTSLVISCFALGGGGISWIRYLLFRAGFQDLLRVGSNGPDLWYYDLFPATGLIGSPFHAVAFASVCILLLMLLNNEKKEAFSVLSLTGLGLAAWLCASIQPYSSVMLVGSYGLLVLVSILAGAPPRTVRKRAVLSGVMLLGAGPSILSGLLASRKPVWNMISMKAMQLSGFDWASGYFVLWILAGGSLLYMSRKEWEKPMAVIWLWSGMGAFLLLVLNSGMTKLCSALTIPLALAAGTSIDHLIGKRTETWSIRLATSVLIVLALASSGINVGHFFLKPPRVDSELLHASLAIRENHGRGIPWVLTDAQTGDWLPGLIGGRVYAGNAWFTDYFTERNSVLRSMGFQCTTPVVNPLNSREGDQAERLAKLILEGRFGYLLLNNDCVLAGEWKAEASSGELYRNSTYCVYVLNADGNARLANGLNAQIKTSAGSQAEARRSESTTRSGIAAR